jgi:hypothetical protein
MYKINKSLFFTTLLLTFLSVTSYAQDKKVAVVTFFINKQIDATSFGTIGQTAALKLCDDPNFNLTGILKEFHSQFFDSYAKEFPFKLLPESEVTNNETYKAYKVIGNATSGVFDISKYTTSIDGYKVFVVAIGRENEKNMLKIFPQADGVMHVSITFKLVKLGFGGMGIVRMRAITDIILLNKNGDKVFNIEEDATSKSVTPLVGGVPVITADKILPMCESALTELMGYLQKDMAKMVKKSNAKL